MVRRVLLITAFAFGLIVAGCSGGSDTEAVESSTTAPTTSSTTTTTEAPATTVAETTTSTTEAATFTETSDMVYMTMNGAELLMDVYTPAGDGPWPVVVAFHGLDSDGKDGLDTTVVAESAAAAGMVVFAPSWIVWDPGPFPITIEVFEMWKKAANCAVAFAQQNAADHGGDPANTVVYGFSAGAGVALIASLQPTGGPIPGCGTDASPTLVTGAVLGDGEYFLHSGGFDGAFQADLEAMQAEVASLTDATYWPPDLNAEFFLWVAEGGTSPRAIDDPNLSGWLDLRDPDGSIRTDLDGLGQLEDGIISFIDAGRLLELRLSTAGIKVTLDEYPGGHTPRDKVPELVDYLKAAATN